MALRRTNREEGGWEGSWEAKLSTIWKAYPRTSEKAYMPGMALALSRLTLSRVWAGVEIPCIELFRAVEISRWLGPYKARL